MYPFFLNEFLFRIPGDICGHLHTFGYEEARSLAQQADLVWSSQSSQLIQQGSKDNIAEENFCSKIHNSRQKNQKSQDTSAMAGWCNIHMKYGLPRTCSFSLKHLCCLYLFYSLAIQRIPNPHKVNLPPSHHYPWKRLYHLAIHVYKETWTFPHQTKFTSIKCSEDVGCGNTLSNMLLAVAL